METKNLWFEVTVAGIVHLVAIVFFVLSLLDIYSISDYEVYKDYVPYLFAFVVVGGYVIGLVAHYLIPAVGLKILPGNVLRFFRHEKRNAKTSPKQRADISKKLSLQAQTDVRRLLYGNEQLSFILKRGYSDLVLFRLLSSGFLLLGLSLIFWLVCSPIHSAWWIGFPFIGAAILFMLLYRIAYPRYAATEAAASDEITRKMKTGKS